MAETKSVRVKLDWSRLLGFDQANVSATENGGGKAREPGAKIGKKKGIKAGIKVGIKVGVKPVR